MRAKHLHSGLIVLLGCILLWACDLAASSASTDPPIGVTPVDTSASTLIVTIKINEDQDATDHMSNMAFQFKTNVIEENNYVIFDDQENVTCDGDGGPYLKLNNQQTYTLKVPQQRYTCWYTGDTTGMGKLPPVLITDVATRSRLSPQPPLVNGQGYKLSYTPDPDSLACSIKAYANDSSGKSIQGSSSWSNLGSYIGPATNTLSGSGEIILQRTCFWKLHSPFDTVYLTYQSTASVEVTWS